MSDFIIQFGDHIDPESIVQSLRRRPWLQDRPIHLRTYTWGHLILQESAGMKHAPFIDNGTIVGCVGRPRLLNKPLANRSFNDLCKDLAYQWDTSTDLRVLLNDLTGMFSLVKANAQKVSILTDHMGAQPVYSAHNANGKMVGIGTDVQILAMLSDRQQDFDQVSLGELLVHNNITFPFSSRNGITEFQPAAVINVDFDDLNPSVSETVLWIPEEPESPITGLVDDLVDRMRAAGSDIALSANSIGVTLSGGLDSRAVLSVLPKDKVTAITYVTHENYETDTARAVAKQFGCKHLFARRSEDFFCRLLLENGPAILGSERRAMLHGLCITESGLSDNFDVILGGQLSDTYLKDHYMPKWQREKFRLKGPKERLGILLRKILNISQPIHLPGIGSNLGRYRLEKYLSQEVRYKVRQRRTRRLNDVRRIRPSTAEEWVKFWPTSRQDDFAHVMGNSKLFPFETLFLHRYIIEFSSKLMPPDRYSGAVASQAFTRLYGELRNIHDANTGQLPGTINSQNTRPRGFDSKHQGAKVWNNVSHSWFDMVALQKYAPEWQNKRRELMVSGALDILDPILDRSDRKSVV